jgi:hypothetical protein
MRPGGYARPPGVDPHRGERSERAAQGVDGSPEHLPTKCRIDVDEARTTPARVGLPRSSTSPASTWPHRRRAGSGRIVACGSSTAPPRPSCARPRFGHAGAGSTRIRAMLDGGSSRPCRSGRSAPRRDRFDWRPDRAPRAALDPPGAAAKRSPGSSTARRRQGRERGLDALWAEVDAAAREFEAAYAVRASAVPAGAIPSGRPPRR